jgi:hypothetical protein
MNDIDHDGFGPLYRDCDGDCECCWTFVAIVVVVIVHGQWQ